MKKTLLIAALISSAVVASQASATALTKLVNNNTTSQWIAMQTPAGCSAKLGSAGMVAPNSSQSTSTFTINASCLFNFPCTTTMYAFPTEPTPTTNCTSGTLVATSHLQPFAAGHVDFDPITSGYTVTPGTADADATGTITETIGK